MKKRSVLMLALIVVFPACGGDGEAAAPPPTTAPVVTTTTTEPAPPPPDPFTIPEDPAGIDAAYVEAVANELYRIIGDAGRILMDGGPPEEVVKRYDAVYAPWVKDAFLLETFALADTRFPNVQRPLGNASVRVHSVLDATESCILASATQDVGAVLVDPPPPVEGVLVLFEDPQRTEVNRTAWVTEGLAPMEEIGGRTCADF